MEAQFQMLARVIILMAAITLAALYGPTQKPADTGPSAGVSQTTSSR